MVLLSGLLSSSFGRLLYCHLRLASFTELRGRKLACLQKSMRSAVRLLLLHSEHGMGYNAQHTVRGVEMASALESFSASFRRYAVQLVHIIMDRWGGLSFSMFTTIGVLASKESCYVKILRNEKLHQLSLC